MVPTPRVASLVSRGSVPLYLLALEAERVPGPSLVMAGLRASQVRNMLARVHPRLLRMERCPPRLLKMERCPPGEVDLVLRLHVPRLSPVLDGLTV
jgi:hypothetical protein